MSKYPLEKLQKVTKSHLHQTRGQMANFKSNEIRDQGMEPFCLCYVLKYVYVVYTQK